MHVKCVVLVLEAGRFVFVLLEGFLGSRSMRRISSCSFILLKCSSGSACVQCFDFFVKKNFHNLTKKLANLHEFECSPFE